MKSALLIMAVVFGALAVSLLLIGLGLNELTLDVYEWYEMLGVGGSIG